MEFHLAAPVILPATASAVMETVVCILLDRVCVSEWCRFRNTSGVPVGNVFRDSVRSQSGYVVRGLPTRAVWQCNR